MFCRFFKRKWERFGWLLGLAYGIQQTPYQSYSREWKMEGFSLVYENDFLHLEETGNAVAGKI